MDTTDFSFSSELFRQAEAEAATANAAATAIAADSATKIPLFIVMRQRGGWFVLAIELAAEA